MKYISTRGEPESLSFIDAVMEGLARDGGLLIPEKLPDFSDQLKELSHCSYQELALKIFTPFVGETLPQEQLKEIIIQSYSGFAHQEITPLIHLKRTSILELFHGPTLAFKDVALQFLGNLFSCILKERNQKMNILGATSGDTGSAAIYGVKGKERISIFILHPHEKVSPIQRRQMTCVLDKNVHNIAIDGNFDNAQAIVKEIFNDLEFKDHFRLGAVNSINWARIMAQIVYYFYAAFRFQSSFKNPPLVYSVPTGNFGDIYAGYLAKKMGLPIKNLILATNENNILSKTLETGVYKIGTLVQTFSPSMDIQVSSNFERLLFDLLDRDGNQVKEKMRTLKETKQFDLGADAHKKAQEDFVGIEISTNETLECIRKISKEEGMIIDPHTAVGVAAARKYTDDHVICLATAHPAKFGDAIFKATGKSPIFPHSLKDIMEKEESYQICKPQVSSIKELIRNQVRISLKIKSSARIVLSS